MARKIDHKPHEHADNITNLHQNRYVGILRLYFTLISAWQHICTAPNFPRPGAGILPTAIEIGSLVNPRGLQTTSWPHLGPTFLNFGASREVPKNHVFGHRSKRAKIA